MMTRAKPDKPGVLRRMLSHPAVAVGLLLLLLVLYAALPNDHVRLSKAKAFVFGHRTTTGPRLEGVRVLTSKVTGEEWVMVLGGEGPPETGHDSDWAITNVVGVQILRTERGWWAPTRREREPVIVWDTPSATVTNRDIVDAMDREIPEFFVQHGPGTKQLLLAGATQSHVLWSGHAYNAVSLAVAVLAVISARLAIPACAAWRISEPRAQARGGPGA